MHNKQEAGCVYQIKRSTFFTGCKSLNLFYVNKINFEKQNEWTQNYHNKRFTVAFRIWLGTNQGNFFEHYPLPLRLAKNLGFKHNHFVPVISANWQIYRIEVPFCSNVDCNFLEIFLHIIWCCTNLWSCLCSFLGFIVNSHWVKTYGSFFRRNKQGPINFHPTLFQGTLSCLLCHQNGNGKK